MNDPFDHDQATNDLIDEILELDFEDMVTSKKLRKAYQDKHPSDMPSRDYYHNLLSLQAEMIKLQDWVKETHAKILIICEGRDSAGKGSVIKRITQRMDPRVARAVALPKPTEREMSQWGAFQPSKTFYSMLQKMLPGERVLYKKISLRSKK